MNCGSNLYAYAAGNPVSLQDPTGLSPNSGDGSCRCSAKPHYHSIEQAIPKFVGGTHSFWELNNNGDHHTYSGEPTRNWHSDSRLNPQQDIDPATDPEFSPDSYPSLDCQLVEDMIASFSSWPQNTIPYDPSGFASPNSNSFARYLGEQGYLSPSPPPGALGWYTHIPPPVVDIPPA